MNELLVSAITTLGSGVLGGAAAIFEKIYTAKQELKKAQIDLELTKLNHSHELQMTQIGNVANLETLDKQMQAAVIDGEYKGLVASMEADKASYSVGSQSKLLTLVDFVRGIMRPMLTGALVFYIGLAVVYITLKYDVELSNAQVYDLLFHLILSVTSSANIALTWWFGSRKLNEMGK